MAYVNRDAGGSIVGTITTGLDISHLRARDISGEITFIGFDDGPRALPDIGAGNNPPDAVDAPDDKKIERFNTNEDTKLSLDPARRPRLAGC